MNHDLIRTLYQSFFLTKSANRCMNYSNLSLVLFLVFVISIGIFGFNSAYAHKALIVGDYKLDVGWKTEPPVANEPNAIELILSIATDFDKQRYESVAYSSTLPTNDDDISGLADNLEVDITIGSEKKVFLTLIEDSKIHGLYSGEFTPDQAGATKVHVYGIIKDADFEATFHPEKVEENTKPSETVSIPDWIRNNAKWWSEDAIDDSDFTSGLQYLIKNNILIVPVTQQGAGNSQEIPSWIKNNAGWWADGLITNDDFVKGIQYMITNGIISV